MRSDWWFGCGFNPGELLAPIPNPSELISRLAGGAAVGHCEREFLKASFPRQVLEGLEFGSQVSLIGRIAGPVLTPLFAQQGVETPDWFRPYSGPLGPDENIDCPKVRWVSSLRLGDFLPMSDMAVCTSPELASLLLFGEHDLEQVAMSVRHALVFPLPLIDQRALLVWGRGFSKMEEEAGQRWRWCDSLGASAEINIHNSGYAPVSATIAAKIGRVSGWKGACVCQHGRQARSSDKWGHMRFRTTLQPGPNRLVFKGDRQPILLPGESRWLSFNVQDLRVKVDARESIEGADAYKHQAGAGAAFTRPLALARILKAGFSEVKILESGQGGNAHIHWCFARRLPSQ